MSRVVEAARTWLGTPYVHQASCRGAGCDCLGLVRGVWRQVIGREPAALPAYTPDWSEADRCEALWHGARAHLREGDPQAPAPGQVLLFRMTSAGVAKHLGILTAAGAAPRFIHSYSGQGVCESPLSLPWRRRLVAVFDFPEGAI
ncbi:NlpC/P60 family protein [Palleronia rufa]|uniref:NlpC/P60 family protein n=1 Tax=Palleronia rufa TaxID=1530186 RepID=UPI0005617588|nr:NlpC/P60 family protein [Palleronia rufa]